MTQKQIEKLARQYVDKVYGGDMDFYDEAVNVISFIAERYYLSNKNKLKHEYQRVTDLITPDNGIVSCAMGTKLIVMGQLFPELKNIK